MQRFTKEDRRESHELKIALCLMVLRTGVVKSVVANDEEWTIMMDHRMYIPKDGKRANYGTSKTAYALFPAIEEEIFTRLS